MILVDGEKVGVIEGVGVGAVLAKWVGFLVCLLVGSGVVGPRVGLTDGKP